MRHAIYLHLGLPKTATTTLQNRIFPKHGSYLYLGKQNPKFTPDAGALDAWLRELKVKLITKDRPYFGLAGDDLLKALRNRFGDALEKHERWLISEEGILARCLSPAAYGRLRQFGSAYDVLDKLALLFDHRSIGQIKIILVLRRQDGLLHSLFAQDYQNYSSILGQRTVAELVDYLEGAGAGGPADALLDFAALERYCSQLFGGENVLLLPYEMLCDRPLLFMENLSRFMEIEPWQGLSTALAIRDNRRSVGGDEKKVGDVSLLEILVTARDKMIGQRSLGMGRRLSRLQRFVVGSRTVKVREHDRVRLLNRYKESNRLLVESRPVFSQYGYSPFGDLGLGKQSGER